MDTGSVVGCICLGCRIPYRNHQKSNGKENGTLNGNRDFIFLDM